MAKQKTVKKVFKGIILVVLILLFAVAGYATYFVTSFSRIGDMALMPETGNSTSVLVNNREYSLLSWNIGFGAYDCNYGFFMDGGKSGRANSQQAVYDNINGMLDSIDEMQKETLGNVFDFICFQEVDIDGTRSYHVNQKQLITNRLSNYSTTFAQNYDSPYIAIPLFDMHGKNRAGMLTMSNFKIESAKRVELPVTSGLSKYFDLDRCLSVNRIPLSSGKYLVLINLHLVAYTADDNISDEQVKVMLDICKTEYQAGNYVICAGDFNRDILGNSPEVFKTEGNYSWNVPFNNALLKNTGMTLIAPQDEQEPVPTARTADGPYVKGESFVTALDGFLISDNVNVKASKVFDLGFKYSDHNPVMLKFLLK